MIVLLNMVRKMNKNYTFLIIPKEHEKLHEVFCFLRWADAPGLYDLLNSVIVVTQFKFSPSTCHYLYQTTYFVGFSSCKSVCRFLNKSPVIFGHEINGVFIWVSWRIFVTNLCRCTPLVLQHVFRD